jgi:hypothetical protein
MIYYAHQIARTAVNVNPEATVNANRQRAEGVRINQQHRKVQP